MKIKNLAKKMFDEIVEDYENEKMIKDGGLVKRTTSKEFLSK